MTEDTRRIVRAYVEAHGRAKVAEAAMVADSTITNWLRAESNVAHRTPTTQTLALLATRLGDPKKTR